MIKKLVSILRSIFQYMCSFIYDTFIVLPLTSSIYKDESARLNRVFIDQQSFSMIDIGCGTGLPLLEFMKTSKCNKVQAIDIDEGYVVKAKQRFQNDERVLVKFKNFMNFDETNKERFDVVFFGFSFMLMPDKVEALKKCRNLITDNGKIYMYLTLYHKKNLVAEFIKPKIKFLTSIDFGDTMYLDEIPDILKKANFSLVSQERVASGKNLLKKMFNVYRLEVKPIN